MPFLRGAFEPNHVLRSYVASGKRMVILPYGPLWRTHRAALHREMTPAKIESYTVIQTHEARVLMKKLHREPKEFFRWLQEYNGNVISKGESVDFRDPAYSV